MHDTLTVKEELVRDPKKFYNLAEMIGGKNYLVTPHEVIWENDTLISTAPLWFDMHQPNSLGAWIIYYFERALFIQQ
jgi:hypothetical protein